MIRFLRYAVEHGRKIRTVYCQDGQILQKTVSVVSYDGACVTLRVGSKGRPFTLPLSDVLSCDYARGDHGEE